MNADEAINRVVETIRDEYQPEKIILFGSRIWGDTDADSDPDVLIIKESNKREPDRIREVSRMVRRYQQGEYLLPLDILVKTPDEVQQRLAIGDDFIREIVTRGRVAYERSVTEGTSGASAANALQGGPSCHKTCPSG